jgi:hypothetical protein
MKSNVIPDRIRIQVDEVASYAGECDDWVTIKKEIMKGIPSTMRKKFSRRNSLTKEQEPNDFDFAVITYYKERTDIDLKIRTLHERRDMKGYRDEI